MSLYSKATEFDRFNDRGFTPFQFSSRMTQTNVSQFGGLIPENPISDLINERSAWYEMWINPQKISLNRDFLQKKQHTAGSIVTYHYRADATKMKVSGVCGWIAINPQKDKDERSLFSKNVFNIAKRHSPRIFLERLRNIAEENMYFVDLNGIEHYNTKYIRIFTKQYPDGMICEGYYTSFNIPEEGEDAQTITYDFDFIVETMMPVMQLKSMIGMFGGTGGGGAKKTLSPLPGIM